MNPAVIRWARETAGLSLVEAAAALHVSPAEKLLAMEQGEERVSRPLLVRMSKEYRRSLLTFYLAEPPRKGNRGRDFRTLPDQRAASDEALLDALVRDVMARQDMVRSIVWDEEEGRALPYVGSCTLEDSIETVRSAITDQLGFRLSEFRAKKTPEDAFSYIREKAERAGIFVLLAGNLGSYHSAIAVETFRGFAIADSIAPFVVINDQDAKTAWSFTLLHEIAHLWLGATGVSGSASDMQIERFCNEVASTILLPRDELPQIGIDDVEWTPAALLQAISRFAGARHLSHRMVAYTLLRAGLVEEAMWREVNKEITALWDRARGRQREQAKLADGGPNYYVVRRHRLGTALLNLVDRSLGIGALTPVKAAKVLGVRPRSVNPLLADRGTSSAAGRA